MHKDEIKAIFDRQASGYDNRWEKTAAIRDALHFLLEAVFFDLPANARMLCVGMGTGDELVHLARRFPDWSFVGVEPSGAMLTLCREKAERNGFSDRCQFHEGYLETLPEAGTFDGATCFLVSQFMLDREARIDFFRGIASRLRPGAILASSDLASDVDSPEYEWLLGMWLNMMLNAGVATPDLAQMRAAYAKDVAVLPPAQITDILRAAGFETPTLFHQAGLIHAWLSKRPRETAL